MSPVKMQRHLGGYMGGSSGGGKGGPISYLLAGTVGFVLGYLVCHFHVCERIGICAPMTVEQPPIPDPGPR